MDDTTQPDASSKDGNSIQEFNRLDLDQHTDTDEYKSDETVETPSHDEESFLRESDYEESPSCDNLQENDIEMLLNQYKSLSSEKRQQFNKKLISGILNDKSGNSRKEDFELTLSIGDWYFLFTEMNDSARKSKKLNDKSSIFDFLEYWDHIKGILNLCNAGYLMGPAETLVTPEAYQKLPEDFDVVLFDIVRKTVELSGLVPQSGIGTKTHEVLCLIQKRFISTCQFKNQYTLMSYLDKITIGTKRYLDYPALRLEIIKIWMLLQKFGAVVSEKTIVEILIQNMGGILRGKKMSLLESMHVPMKQTDPPDKTIDWFFWQLEQYKREQKQLHKLAYKRY